jgi:hypothetical protein
MNGTTIVPARLMNAPAHRTQKPRPRPTGRFDVTGAVTTDGRCVPITAERAGCQGMFSSDRDRESYRDDNHSQSPGN